MSCIDNLEEIKQFIKPVDSNDYWFLQIIARRKDNPDLPRSEKYIKDYYLSSIEDLERNIREIKELSKFFNARVYFHPRARSFKRLSLSLISEIADRVKDKSYRVHRISRAVSGSKKAWVDREDVKYWMIDVDTTEISILNRTISIINSCDSAYENPVVTHIPTPNGFHIVTKPFNTAQFNSRFGDNTPEVHKNSPILAYFFNA